MLVTVILFIVLGISMITDMKSRKIFNVITMPAMLFGLFYHTYLSGFQGLLFSIIGLLIGFFLLLIPFLLGGMGAGDLKLLAAVGAILGGEMVFQSFLYTALVGGIFAILIIFKNNYRLEHWKKVWFSMVYFRSYTNLFQPKSLQQSYTIPYGVPIAIGVASLYCFGAIL